MIRTNLNRMGSGPPISLPVRPQCAAPPLFETVYKFPKWLIFPHSCTVWDSQGRRSASLMP